MQYKDLIYKITSNTEKKDMNDAKKSVQPVETFIGVMVGDIVLNKGITDALKTEIDRTLTVLFNSPISNSFVFLPYDIKTLTSFLDLFPDKTNHFIATDEQIEELNAIKKNKLNLGNIYRSINVNVDFVKKIDYLFTINVDVIEQTLKFKLDEKRIMILPLTFRGTNNFSQKEKLVIPDPTGWVYNGAAGTWSKNWGKDGSQTIPSWKAPDDWNLSVDPDPKTGA